MSRFTCLITGAGRGLGQAIALHLAGPEAHLLLHYNHSEAGAREVAEAVAALGGSAGLLQADLSDAAERDRLMDAVAEQAPALHVLVNNAGVYPQTDLLELKPAEWQVVLDVTCSAVFHLTQRALPLLRAGVGEVGRARIVNVGDSGADRIVARVLATPYHVAKLGVHVLTRSFARELAPERITVNQISPGFLDTSVGEPVTSLPAGRPGTAPDILAALDYLLSPAADYVSGANLVISGAWNL